MRHVGSLVSAALVAIGCLVLGPTSIAGCGSSRSSGFADDTMGMMDAGGVFDEAGNPIFGDGGRRKEAGLRRPPMPARRLRRRRHDDPHRHGVRAERNPPPLQRHRLRAERAARSDPPGRLVRQVRRAGLRLAGRHRAERLDGKLHPQQRARRGRTSPSFSRSESGAGRSIDPERRALRGDRSSPIPNMTRLPKNQSEGRPPEDRRHHRRARSARLHSPEDRHRRVRVRLRGRHRCQAREPLRRKRRQLSRTRPGRTNAPSATPFWSDANQLKAYDIVLLSCEGGENIDTNTAAALSAMEAYTNMGGRIFGSHYHYVWFQYGSAAFQSTAQWQGDGNANDRRRAVQGRHELSEGRGLRGLARRRQAHRHRRASPPQPHEGRRRHRHRGDEPEWVTDSARRSTKYLSFNTPVGAAAADRSAERPSSATCTSAAAAATRRRSTTRSPPAARRRSARRKKRSRFSSSISRRASSRTARRRCRRPSSR